MIVKFWVKKFILSKFFDNVFELLYWETSFLTAFVGFLELTSPNNFVNHLSRSAHISSISV